MSKSEWCLLFESILQKKKSFGKVFVIIECNLLFVRGLLGDFLIRV